MFEFLTRTFVLVGYLTVVVNMLLILKNCACSKYRKRSLYAMGSTALGWGIFYTLLELNALTLGVAAPLSRVFHTVTIVGLWVMQYNIQKASDRELMDLEKLVQGVFEEEEDGESG